MRLDEDSFVWSAMQYNVEQYMLSKGLVYAYRMMNAEDPKMVRGLIEAVRAWLLMTPAVSPRGLLAHCGNLTSAAWDRDIFYNNFFVTRVGFWMQPHVQSFLRFLDRTGGMYELRHGDAPIHTIAVELFAHPAEVYKMQDFTYEHARFYDDGCLHGGGFVAGSEDPEGQQRLQAFVTAHGKALRCVEEDRCW
jgi:alpha 1,2-mannosyltransferase